MPYPVNPRACEDSKDPDLDTFVLVSDGVITAGAVQTGGGLEAETGGGALFGGGPEESKSVTKNPSPEPELFWNVKIT